MLKRESKKFKVKFTLKSIFSPSLSSLLPSSKFTYSIFWKRGRKKDNSGRTQFLSPKSNKKEIESKKAKEGENGPIGEDKTKSDISKNDSSNFFIFDHSFQLYATMFYNNKKTNFRPKTISFILEKKNQKNQTKKVAKGTLDLSTVIPVPTKENINNGGVTQTLSVDIVFPKKKKNFLKLNKRVLRKKKGEKKDGKHVKLNIEMVAMSMSSVRGSSESLESQTDFSFDGESDFNDELNLSDLTEFEGNDTVSFKMNSSNTEELISLIKENKELKEKVELFNKMDSKNENYMEMISKLENEKKEMLVSFEDVNRKYIELKERNKSDLSSYKLNEMRVEELQLKLSSESKINDELKLKLKRMKKKKNIQEEIGKYQKQLEVLTKEKEELSRKNLSLTMQINKNKQLLNDKERLFEKERIEKGNVERKLNEQIENYNKLKDIERDLNVKISQLNEKEKQNVSKILKIEFDNKQLLEKNDILVKEKSDINAKLLLLKKVDSMKVSKKIASLKEKITKIKRERDTTHDNLKTKVSDNLIYKRQNENQKDQIKRLKMENEDLKNAISEDKKQIRTMEFLLEQQNEKINILMKDSNVKGAEKSKKELSSLRNDKKGLLKKIEEFQKIIEKVSNDKRKMENEQITFVEIKNDYEDYQKELQNTIKEQKNRILNLTSTIRDIKANQEGYKKDIIRMRNEIKVNINDKVKKSNVSIDKKKVLIPMMEIESGINKIERCINELNDFDFIEVDSNSNNNGDNSKKNEFEYAKYVYKLKENEERNVINRFVIDQIILFHQYKPKYLHGNIPQILKPIILLLQHEKHIENNTNSFFSLLLSSVDFVINNCNTTFHIYFMNVFVYVFNLYIDKKLLNKILGVKNYEKSESNINYEATKHDWEMKKIPKRYEQKMFLISKKYEEKNGGNEVQLIFDILCKSYWFLLSNFLSVIKPHIVDSLLVSKKKAKNTCSIVIKLKRMLKLMKDNHVNERIITHFYQRVAEYIDMKLFNMLLLNDKSKNAITVSNIIELKMGVSKIDRFFQDNIGKRQYFEYIRQSCDVCAIQNVDYFSDKHAKGHVCPKLSLLQIKIIQRNVVNEFVGSNGKKKKRKKGQLEMEIEEKMKAVKCKNNEFARSLSVTKKVFVSQYEDRYGRKKFFECLFVFDLEKDVFFDNVKKITKMKSPSTLLNFSPKLKKILSI